MCERENMSTLNDKNISTMSFDEIDELLSPAPEEVTFDEVVDRALSRRDFFKGAAVLFGSGLFVQSTLVQAMSSKTEAFDVYGFENVLANSDDTITLPEGYQWKPMVSWGDPLSSQAKEFENTSKLSSATQALAFGDNNDGMKHFNINGREVLAINNEYVNMASFFHHHESKSPQTKDDIVKTQQAVGVSIVEVKEGKRRYHQKVGYPVRPRAGSRTKPLHGKVCHRS